MKEMSKKDMAKKEMLMALRKLGHDKMAGDMFNNGPLQKVTVASDNKEGLKKGLEKAEEVLEKMPDMSDMKKDMENESEEYSEDKMPSEEDLASMSKEELVKFIKENY